MTDDILLVASGDLRLSANRVCWPAQQQLEAMVTRAFAGFGRRVLRAHPVDTVKGHGFLDSQARGIEVFRTVDPDARLIVAEAVWQYTNHLLPGLTKHRGPILTLANWSGEWPGLVGMLNLNASLTKAGIPFSTIWSEDFTDAFARRALDQWLREGRITHDTRHARPIDGETWPAGLRLFEARGVDLARSFRQAQAIMGIFDEGCMGMYNAIIPDHLLHAVGVFKERLSQSALYAEMRGISDTTAARHYRWLTDRGMTFAFGPNPAEDLTHAQVLEGLKMYDAAVQIAARFGCDAIGIQYQQGLKDVCVASDLAEGLLNDSNRPPVLDASGRELFAGRPVPHFNEVDECAGLDALLTNRIWTDLGIDPSTTLHDVRWGSHYRGHGVDEFVWVLEISGAVPPSHLEGGYGGATGERQPPMYFPLGGSTIKGISKPGEIVWSRIYVEGDALHMDIGRGGVVRLPAEQAERYWRATTPQWPMMPALLYGVTRNQFMAKHQANHIQVVYAPDAEMARRGLVIKAAMARELGIGVNLCGDVDDTLDRHQPPKYRT
jgi:L-fucose isomerase-like protein